MNSDEFDSITKKLRAAATELSLLTASQKERALFLVAEEIRKNAKKIISENATDLSRARDSKMSEALLERLSLDEKRIEGIAKSVESVAHEREVVGEIVSGWKTATGLEIREVRVPLGVIAIIYESRPNVTVDAFCLAFKSGNAILLRGSKSALNSNQALFDAIKTGLKRAGETLSLFWLSDSLSLMEPQADHSDVDEILNARGKIDCVLPRGGAALIQRVVQNAKVPVIETGAGVCHLFVDESANLEKAVRIAENAKIQRPGACNAIECILVHEKIADDFLPLLEKTICDRVELRCDEKSYQIIIKNARHPQKIVKATERDFGFEFLDFVCAVKIVSSVENAVDYINAASTKHSEAICTESRAAARFFQSKVDSACVYVNASTRFTDGGEFGFGAEVGISTQKLHARGPMGISALTTIKFLIDGDGQVR